MIPTPVSSVQLKDWQILSLGSGSIAIGCITGVIWVTWPNCMEVVLSSGQQIKLEAAGKVCVQALAASVVNVVIR